MSFDPHCHPLVVDLIRALGLRDVMSMTINFPRSGVVTVTAEFAAPVDDLSSVFKRYALSAELIDEVDGRNEG